MAKNLMMPQSYSELERWSQRAAGTDFVPKEYRGKPDAVLVCAQYAIEIGLGIVEGLRSIAVINGKPSLYGDGLIALCLASPVCEYVKETPLLDDKGFVTGYICQAKRYGSDEKVARFTIEDAHRAKLATKQGPWQEYPQRMLQMRARGFALRDAFPDVIKGLISREEAEDYPTDTAAPVIEGEKFPAPHLDSEQVERLQQLVAETQTDTRKMLEAVTPYATSLLEISPGDYTRVVNLLTRKKQRMEEQENGES